MKLSNGTVIPSNITPQTVQGTKYGHSFYNKNMTMKVGQVVKVIHPDDSKSHSKLRDEYDVMVYESIGSGPPVPVLYSKCILANMFGSVADNTSYTLRAVPSGQKGVTPVGSTVLILCAGGKTTIPYIIGFVPNPNTNPDDPSLGHHWHFQFNGLEQNIDDDGKYTVDCKGSTDDSGIASGINPTNITMDSDGNITAKNSGTESIKIDSTELSIAVDAGVKVDVTAPLTNINSEQCVVNSGVDFVLKANPLFLSQFMAMHGALLAAMQTLAATLLALNKDINPLIVPPGPSAGKLPTTLVALPAALAAVQATVPLITSYMETMVPEVAISVTTRTT